MKQLRGTETILVAEDDEKVLDITRRMLKGYGYRVLTARDGREAMRVAAEHNGPIHLLLTDVIMPEMDGRELANRLREKRPDLRALFMSGYTGNMISHRNILDGDVAFIQKPFAREVLAVKVRKVLGDSETQPSID
ncbi:MAG: response regulator [Deltaproteobacteria bacterium]|nr:MAG: response regulator [Deltaproteobacteria bacterium]